MDDGKILTGKPSIFDGKNHGLLYVDVPLNQSNYCYNGMEHQALEAWFLLVLIHPQLVLIKECGQSARVFFQTALADQVSYPLYLYIYNYTYIITYII